MCRLWQEKPGGEPSVPCLVGIDGGLRWAGGMGSGGEQSQ